MARRLKQKIQTVAEVQGREVPLDLWIEPRKNVRVSIGQKAIILRVPYTLSKKEIYEKINYAENWVEHLMIKKPHIGEHFFPKPMESTYSIQVRDRLYSIQTQYHSKNSHEVKKIDTNIYLKLSDQSPPTDQRSATKKLLSKMIANDFYPEIRGRVQQLNQQYVQDDYNQVRLKYNSSNWGSCSSKRNINLSTRLLFAPNEVLDYVIIHELCHLEYRNHSTLFWDKVRRIMPNYKAQDNWLKTHGHLCDFVPQPS